VRVHQQKNGGSFHSAAVQWCYLLSNVRNKAITLMLPDEFDQNNIAQIG